MRGALADQDETLTELGIIPAYAGSTVGLLIGYIGQGDHPRICGEHSRRAAP